MNLNKLVLAAAMSSVLAVNAYADSGSSTVNFNGTIIDAPCSIAAESLDQTVALGEISNVALANGGHSSPRSFSIKLENCSLSTAKTVTTTFTGAAGVDGKLGITGDAQGAGIVIADGAGSTVTLGQATAAQTLQNGSNTLSFSAYLKGDGGAVTTGEFTSVADFALTYL